MQSSIVNRQSNGVKTFTRVSSALAISLAIFCEPSFACDSIIFGTPIGTTNSKCNCIVGGGSVGGITRAIATGTETASGAVTQCANASDTVCSTATSGSISTASTQYYKHSSGYYTCDWITGTGFVNAQTYTPSGGAVSAPIDFSFSHKPIETFATEIKIK